MLDMIVRTLASLTISVMLIYVPRDKYEEELRRLPTIPERVTGVDLGGWRLEHVSSERTGMGYWYFAFGTSGASKPPLLCLHGFNTDGRIFTKLDSLAEHYRLIALNFPEESYLYNGHLEDFTVVLDDFLESMGIDTLSVMGNSVGGGIALAYTAKTRRTTIRELVLVSTSIFGGTDEERRRLRGMADKLLKYPDYKLYYLLKRGKAILDLVQKTELAERVSADLIVTKRIEWYRQILTALYGYDGREDGKRVTCPVLVVHGTEDRVIPMRSAQVAQEVIERASFVPISGGSHSLAYTNADMLVREIRRFHALNAARALADGNPSSL